MPCFRLLGWASLPTQSSQREVPTPQNHGERNGDLVGKVGLWALDLGPKARRIMWIVSNINNLQKKQRKPLQLAQNTLQWQLCRFSAMKGQTASLKGCRHHTGMWRNHPKSRPHAPFQALDYGLRTTPDRRGYQAPKGLHHRLCKLSVSKSNLKRISSHVWSSPRWTRWSLPWQWERMQSDQKLLATTAGAACSGLSMGKVYKKAT